MLRRAQVADREPDFILHPGRLDGTSTPSQGEDENSFGRTSVDSNDGASDRERGEGLIARDDPVCSGERSDLKKLNKCVHT
jgi:hypothetical protein